MIGDHQGDVGLVGDIGGTNARLALVDATSRPFQVETRACAGYPSLEAVVAEYLHGCGRRVGKAVLAVAGPVINGAIDVTNLGWRTSERAIAAACGVERVRLCNDYAALAHASPRLRGADLHWLGGPREPQEGTLVVLGPGTGFGAAALVREGETAVASVGEAGHVAFAPTDDVECELWRRLAARYGRVSIERILSGRGLAELHISLCAMAGRPVTDADPAEVTAAASAGDRVASQTIDRFCAILGSVAGDLALTFGARGGVQIAGGVAPRLLPWLDGGSFRSRFEAKGRFAGYMRGIATHVVIHPHPALLGAAALLASDTRAWA